MISVAPATPADARALDLRPGDAREIAALGFGKEEAVARSLERSLWAETWRIDGAVAAISGVAATNLLAGIGSPWLLTGRPVDRHARTFLRETAKGIARMRAEFPVLCNHVHAEYRQALAWLRWLGFTIGPAQPYGPLGAPFCQVTMRTGALVVRDASILEIAAAPGIDALLADYAAESAIAGLPAPAARLETYRRLEASGLLRTIVATIGGTPIGFITVLVSELPHYGRLVAVSESFFVAPAHRHSGAGLRLLRAAERQARERGACGLLVSAPSGGRLARVLPRTGYRETNRVFFRPLADA